MLPGDEQPQCERSRSHVEELPPSAKLVLQSLRDTDGMTASQLAGETGFAERTIRYALSTLDELDVVESQYLLSDPQTCEYELTSVGQDLGDLVER